MAWARQRAETGRMGRSLMAVMFLLRCCSPHRDPELHALWYPNVTHSESLSPSCSLIQPGSNRVNTLFYSSLNPQGAPFLRLEAGQFAVAEVPAVGDSNIPVCWIMAAKWEEYGTIMSFEIDDYIIEISMEKSGELELESRGTNSSYLPVFLTTDTITYELEGSGSSTWQTLAFCFMQQTLVTRLYAWSGTAAKRFKFLPQFSSWSYFPTGLRLGLSPLGGSNTAMEVMCVMIVSIQLSEVQAMGQHDMQDFMTLHCGHLPSNTEVLGCIGDALSTELPDTTTPQQPPPEFANQTVNPTFTYEETIASDLNTTTQQSPPRLTTSSTAAAMGATSESSQPSDNVTVVVTTGSSGEGLTESEAVVQSCPSACRCLVTAFSSQVEALPQAYFSSLLLDTTTLSSSRRKKQSATDNRPSAVSAGYAGIVVICVVFLMIVCFDLSSVLQIPRLNARFKRNVK